MSQPQFTLLGGEVVRLRTGHADGCLPAGTLGVVWGVYDTDPPSFEATFIDSAGDAHDIMFQPDEVELTDAAAAPQPILDLKRALETFDRCLREPR